MQARRIEIKFGMKLGAADDIPLDEFPDLLDAIADIEHDRDGFQENTPAKLIRDARRARQRASRRHGRIHPRAT